MATLLQDNFDRANSTTSPGSPQVGGPYTASTGTWGINSNQLYLATLAVGVLLAPGASDVDFYATLPLAQSGSTGPSGGLVVRAADSSNYLFVARNATGTVAVQRLVAGAATALSPDFPSAINDVLRLVCIGRAVYFCINHICVWEMDDSRYDAAATQLGFRNSGSGSTFRWDNALAVDAIDPPNTWGASPSIGVPTPVEIDANLSLTPSLYKGRDTALADESEIP